MNSSPLTVAVSLLLLQLAAASAGNLCHSIPGLPGRDGKDGKDGTPGVPGPAGPPGTSEISYTAYQELRERLTSDILNDARLGDTSTNRAGNCPQTVKTAASCKEIYACNPDSPSGYYWISKGSSPPELVMMYCGMNLTRCGNITGGWTRVAHFDMTIPDGTCPSPLETVSSPRSCSRAGDAGCSSVNYTTFGINYAQVCGRAIGYQRSTADGFYGYAGLGKDIDSPYVDGLSITYGSPRHHLWTYAVGNAESGDADRPGSGITCPCAPVSGAQPPSFVQNHYYCESGNRAGLAAHRWFTEDPLWDGEGCPTNNTCCDPPNLPWFNRAIETPSTADIELRLCQDQSAEDVGLELFELYVY